MGEPKDSQRPLASPFHDRPLHIERKPAVPGDVMAWDNADMYLIEYCAGLELAGKGLLIGDDNYGALSCALSPWDPDSAHYSWCAQASARHNLNVNALALGEQFDWYALPAGQLYDLVVLRMPKSIDLLRDHCLRLRPHLAEGARVICGAMDKYLSKNMLSALEQCIGPTRTSLGKKKARLVFSEFDPALSVSALKPSQYQAEPFALTLHNLPGVFSYQQLDIGARFLLQQWPRIPLADARCIADLGCGNGVLGLCAAQASDDADIHFYDDSSIALASSRLGVEHNFPAQQRFHFHQGDGLADPALREFDLILCNPPFHQGQQQDTGIAERLFAGALGALRQGGEFWVVGNRHLAYQNKLKRIFGNVRQVDSNRKFNVLRAVRR